MDFRRRSRLVSVAALASVAMVAVTPGKARAAEVSTQLDYTATHGCPNATDFEAVVVGRLGYSPFRADARERVIVRIEPSGRTLEGRLEWRDSAGGWIGEQAFPSRTGDCGELARAMGFALALQVQLMAAAATQPRPPDPPAPVIVTPAPAPPPAPASAPVAPEAVTVNSDRTTPGSDLRLSAPSFTVGAGAAMGVGVAASAVPLGRLLGTVQWSRLAVELAGEISAPSTTRRADGAGFAQQELLVSLAGCGVRRALSACLVGKVGQIRVAGQSIDLPATPAALMAQTGLRLRVTHPVGTRFEVSAHADGLVVLTRGTVTLDSVPIWTTPRYAALLGIDFGVRFR